MRSLVTYFLLIIFSSCSNHVKNKENEYALKQYLKTIASYAGFVNTQEDTLVLEFSKGSVSEDTSWTLFVSKNQGIFRCRYN